MEKINQVVSWPSFHAIELKDILDDVELIVVFNYWGFK